MSGAIYKQSLFIRYFIAFFVSAIGTWVQSFAQSWIVYTKTGHDPTSLGWLSLAFAGPVILLTPIGGIIADRFNKRWLLLTTQTLQALCAATLALLAWRGLLQPRYIFALQAIAAALLAVDNPTRQSLLPELVPRALLPVALSINAAIFTGAALLGPALGSALYTRIPAAGIFALNTLSYMLPMAMIASLPTELGRPVTRSSAVHSGSLMSFIRKTPSVRTVLFLAMAVALFGRSFSQLLAAYTREMLQQSATTFGSLLASGGVGALVGSAIMTARASKIRDTDVGARDGERTRTQPTPMLFPLACSAGALLALLSQIRIPLLAQLNVALLGCTATMFTTAVSTTLQHLAPQALRGRLLSLHVVTVIGVPYIGALGLAFVTKSHGVSTALLASAIACTLTACSIHLTVRQSAKHQTIGVRH